MKTSKLFLPTEYATAYELIECSDDKEKFSYEYLVVNKFFNKEQHIDEELMFQAYRFLVRRHPNMNAYYVKNLDGTIERKYALYEDKVHVYFDSISPGDAHEVKSYIQSKRNLEAFKTLPLQKYYFLKTKYDYFLICYSHHAFKDVYIEDVLVQEIMSIYSFLEVNKTASYEEATSHLEKLNDYSVVLENFYKDNNERQEDLVNFLKPKIQNVDIPETSMILKNTNLCKAGKIRAIFNQTQDAKLIMKQKNLKSNQCILTLSQIALQKVFQIKGTLPFWKLNGARPEWAKGVLCSFIKDQVFINPLDESNSFFQQYQDNYSHLKESLIKFNNCDYSNALKVLTSFLGKDCSPKVCFNYYNFNLSCKYTYMSKMFSDEYDVVNSNMNIYLDVSYDNMMKEFSMTIFYKKQIFDHFIIHQLLKFIELGFKHIDKIWNLRIENLSLDYLESLNSKLFEKKPLKYKF